MRARLVISAVAVAGGIGVLVAFAWLPRHSVARAGVGGMHQDSGLSDDVVYVRGARDRLMIMLRKAGHADEETLYSTALSRWFNECGVPDDFGFLPGPDGRWLAVWEAVVGEPEDGRDWLPTARKWSLVRVRDGKRIALGESKGRGTLLPRWSDSRHLMLLGTGGTSACVDLDKGPHRMSLPLAIQNDEARDRLVEYCRRYYREEHQGLVAMSPHLGKDFALFADPNHYHDRYLEPPEYSLLRSVGIPGMRELRSTRDLGSCVPEVALSSDRKLVALADAWDGAPPITVQDFGRPTTVNPCGYHVEVVSAPGGASLWHLRRPPKPYAIPPNLPRVYPSPLPWLTPLLMDLRWSQDGRYLSFTELGYDGHAEVHVVDVSTWRELPPIRDALNAFILPGTAAIRP